MLFKPSNLVYSSAIILFNTLLTYMVIFYARARNQRVWSRACTHTTWLLSIAEINNRDRDCKYTIAIYRIIDTIAQP